MRPIYFQDEGLWINFRTFGSGFTNEKNQQKNQMFIWGVDLIPKGCNYELKFGLKICINMCLYVVFQFSSQKKDC